MPTFRELMKVAEVTFKDNTSGKRMREIEKILRKHHAYSGLTPQKATAILEDLGPTFVKMGQIASNRSDIIPKEYADAFKALRANVSPVPFSVIMETIEDSLGHPWQETFTEIEEDPLGSASVAQVHRARLAQGVQSGERPVEGTAIEPGPVVAVKVRRPNVVDQMAQDITLIKHVLALADLAHVAGGIMLTLDGLVDELARTTAEEVDFCVELGNLERFGRELADQPQVESPYPYAEVSTDEVLVMEYVDGPPINDLAALRAQGDDPEALGRRLAESYVTQVIDNGFFHADPHPGNILVREHAVVWIDLGMTGSLSSSERAIVGKLFASVAKGDAFALKDALLALAKEHGPVDHGCLLEQIGALMASYASSDLADINVGTALLEVIEVLRTQNLTLPPSLTMLARGMMTLEGVLVDIAPKASVVGIISDHVRRQMFTLDAFEAKAKELFAASNASAEALTRLPTQVSNTLDMIDRGQVKVGADLHMPRDLVAALYSVAGTVSLALISAGLFVGSSLISQTNMQPKLLEVPLLGVLGYLGAFVLGVYVIWRTLLTRHQQRNDEKVE
ncbi:ABC1 kinase family protein [Gordonibacter sp.]|uniref:ABC1 kinase family protein n=1 Tax=Gordonibacter sp. TaxID=1968902 RepID=UPI002FC887CD